VQSEAKALDSLAQANNPKLNKITKKVINFPGPTFGVAEAVAAANYTDPALFRLAEKSPKLRRLGEILGPYIGSLG